MKESRSLDCGPRFSEISEHYGVAREGIMRDLKNKVCNFTCVKSYEGDKFQSIDYDA